MDTEYIKLLEHKIYKAQQKFFNNGYLLDNHTKDIFDDLTKIRIDIQHNLALLNGEGQNA